MTVVELKKSIHEQIESIEDPRILEMVNSLLSRKDESEFDIPELHLRDIEQGRKDIANGDFLTQAQFEQRYEQWLKD